MSFYYPINVISFSLTLLKGKVLLDFFSLFFIIFILFGLLIHMLKKPKKIECFADMDKTTQ